MPDFKDAVELIEMAKWYTQMAQAGQGDTYLGFAVEYLQKAYKVLTTPEPRDLSRILNSRKHWRLSNETSVGTSVRAFDGLDEEFVTLLQTARITESDGIFTLRSAKGCVVVAFRQASLHEWMTSVNALRGYVHSGYPNNPSAFVKDVDESTRVVEGYRSSNIWSGRPEDSDAWQIIVALAKGNLDFNENPETVYVYKTCTGRAFIWAGYLLGFVTFDGEGSSTCYRDYWLHPQPVMSREEAEPEVSFDDLPSLEQIAPPRLRDQRRRPRW